MPSPAYIRADRLQTHKAVFSSPRPEHDVYMLSYESFDGEKQWLPLVHVSKKLQQAFATGEVVAIEVHRLAQNGAAMRELPAQPERLLTAVETKDGRRIVDVPERLIRIRKSRLRTAGAYGVCAVAGALLVTPMALALLAVAAAFVVAASDIPATQRQHLA